MYGAGAPTQMSQAVQQGANLTVAQSQNLTEVLSEYDAENLSDSDATEIVTQIKELGIRPGAGLESALSDAGFDATALAEQAGVGGRSDAAGPPPPPPPSGGSGRESVDDTVLSLFEDAVQSYNETEDAESVWSILQPMLEEAGYDTSQSVISFYA